MEMAKQIPSKPFGRVRVRRVRGADRAEERAVLPRQWVRRKHQVQGRGDNRYPDAYLYQELGLLRLQAQTRHFAWAKA